MGSVFLGAAALAGALLAGGSPAAAQDYVGYDTDYDLTAQARSPIINGTPAFVLRLAGSLRYDLHWVDQDIRAGTPGYSQFVSRMDVSLFGSAVADNGLSYGFEYDFDEITLQVHLANRLGRLDMGDTESATEALDINGDTAMVGRGSWARGGESKVNRGGVQGLEVVSVRGVGDTIRYTTPNYGGLTLSASYTEESDNDMVDGSGPTTSEDIWSFAGRYISSYGNYTTLVYGGYERSNNGETLSARGDQEIYSAGALVTGMGAQFAVGWGRTENELDAVAAVHNERREWVDIGASISSGPWAVSVGAAHVIDEAVFATFAVDTTLTAYSASFSYALAPGLAIMGGISVFEINNGTYTGFADAVADANGHSDNQATTFTLTTQMVF